MRVSNLLKTGTVLLLLAGCAIAQQAMVPTRGCGGPVAGFLSDDGDGPVPVHNLPPSPGPALDAPAARPRMSPELALHSYFKLARRQLTELGAYSDRTVVEADLPDTHQHGRYELRRTFSAPKSLAYATVRFIGDSFVKTNIITRLLQSEVDHTEKGQGASIAIIDDNYKFGFKGLESIGDQQVYAFQVKPRKKRPGLFKGRIYLDISTGHLLRAEGSMVKTPSFFVKKVEFVQDYTVVGGFSLPAHVHSVAKTRLLGRAIVDVFHSGYEATPLTQTRSEIGPAPAPGSK